MHQVARRKSILLRKADALALARLVDAALRAGHRIPIEVRNPRCFACPK